MRAYQVPITSPVLCSFFGPPVSKTYQHGITSWQPGNFPYLHASVIRTGRRRSSFSTVISRKNRIFRGKGRSTLVSGNRAFGFNQGGGGGNGNNNRKVLGNLALVIGLGYLTTTGQLGWFFNTIVSIWLFVLIFPILGLGAFLWFASRDLIQNSCPNCGNDIRILKSSLKDGMQLCPYCTQPFSVQNDRFVKESTNFSSDQSPFEQVFNDFPRSSNRSSSEKGKATTSSTIVDIEAEVKDID
ncbi:hypothetical protein ZOSMA_75G00630 [Zostera marina]|uniref:Uncharacterized protein n=1 Tax=Zostera marina TaxID=29655 RepID=A0A0K9NRN8_ZOSMR|nr:hypothetical protein ZOSMA_75G00630 [Zostera marina]